MYRKLLVAGAVIFFGAATLSADFSYHETSRVTGGAMASMLKVAGVFSKQAREPIESNVAIKGDRMARRGQTHGEIVDLGAETFTMIDFQKKTYSVMTFEQMRQAIENATKQVKDNKDTKDADVSLKVSAKATGNSRQIAGYDAKEMAIVIDMEMTDKKNGQSGTMEVTMHVWIAGGIPGAREHRDFMMKMGQKLNWSPGSNPAFQANPDIAKGMAQAYKEIGKLDGTAVLQTLSMGPPGSAPPDGAVPAPPAEEKKDKPSIGGALGGALGGKFGLGKKRNNENQQKPDEAKNTSDANGNGGSLLEMTTEYSNFAQSADPSLFEIPAGFKKVEPEIKKR
jgi:hypothetical protein